MTGAVMVFGYSYFAPTGEFGMFPWPRFPVGTYTNCRMVCNVG